MLFVAVDDDARRALRPTPQATRVAGRIVLRQRLQATAAAAAATQAHPAAAHPALLHLAFAAFEVAATYVHPNHQAQPR